MLIYAPNLRGLAYEATIGRVQRAGWWCVDQLGRAVELVAFVVALVVLTVRLLSARSRTR